MSKTEKRVEWCLRKAKNEIKEGKNNLELCKECIDQTRRVVFGK